MPKNFNSVEPHNCLSLIDFSSKRLALRQNWVLSSYLDLMLQKGSGFLAELFGGGRQKVATVADSGAPLLGEGSNVKIKLIERKKFENLYIFEKNEKNCTLYTKYTT